MWVEQCVILCILVIPIINLYRKIFPPLQVIEIFAGEEGHLADKINEVPYKYHVADFIQCNVPEKELREAISHYDAVLIGQRVSSNDKDRLLKLCFKENKRVYFSPRISDILVRASDNVNLWDTPIYLNKNAGISPFSAALKRFFDIVLSAAALIILSPIMVGVAIAIKIEDGGPVLYKQERVTKNGKHFMILKFRSMIVDAEKDGRPHPAGEKDDRITKVGKVIRACRFDELPQLINIIKGDMSIVGPRPERYEQVEEYTRENPEFALRQKVKGGLTGYAQVYGKYNTTAMDKLKLDLIYITNYSLLLDLQIIFETIKILFRKESTEGFSAEQAKTIHDNAETKDDEE
jgi:exopolysaccharide biosynthesis polyprenyl glycosylphosphotransferase